ncbi:alpha-galactosidase [Lachnospiraceae bacterium KM106-2]|nr:alpha-galactosidase [Lachnospiraceae bacterium KM106-2]
MITQNDKVFGLHTKNTSYCFRVLESGHLEHLHYGRKIRMEDGYLPLVEERTFVEGNAIAYDNQYPGLSFENMCLEVSTLGTGDVREPMVQLTYADGSTTSDFRYDSHEILEEMEDRETLPGSYGTCETLKMKLKDANHNVWLYLYYQVYEECDVITRSAKIVNEEKEAIQLNRFLSNQVDFDENRFELLTFHGSWTNEMNRDTVSLTHGIYVNDSKTGTSSNRSNPLMILKDEDASEDYGDCYGFNLIYSGNHFEAVEVTGYEKVRFLSGIQPNGFSYELNMGEAFESPEAIMTFSHEGLNEMSHHMHAFVQDHVVRGPWRTKERPILINSWESFYFDYNQSKLLKLAKQAKSAGVELFVIDDGWFGERNSDDCSLGDWDVNPKKFPGGLMDFTKKIKALDMEVGIWIEPEMVNEKSKLYEEHPDWIVGIPNQRQALGRNQYILDLTRSEVRDHIVAKICALLETSGVSYVKWDMNRIFTDQYSISLPANRQGEFMHRYVMGLYEVLGRITSRFPEVLLESCAASGNRFDLGMLCYSQQIWASDNTDAVCRARIQYGYSYGYPMSALACHVSSCPNHQTLRNTPFETRFQVAAFGVLGYECNIAELSSFELEQMKEQIRFYKENRKNLQFGTFYRSEDSTKGNYQWITVSKDQRKAYAFLMQKEIHAHHAACKLKVRGLNKEFIYELKNRPLKFSIKDFGSLVNTVSPVHIKKDSIAESIADRFVKMDSEKEHKVASGDVFMYGGVKLRPSFCGVGYNENTRFFTEYGSRIYVIQAI